MGTINHNGSFRYGVVVGAVLSSVPRNDSDTDTNKEREKEKKKIEITTTTTTAIRQ
jgi:hypothetical protein